VVRSNWLISSTVMSALMLVSAACRPSGINYGLPAIVGTITYYQPGGRDSAYAAVTVNGTRLVPVVAVNAETLKLVDYTGSGEYLWNSTWRSDNLGVAPDSDCVLHVYQSDGEAHSGRQVLPRHPVISGPEIGGVFAQGRDFMVFWDGVPKINRYELTLNLDYTYNNVQQFQFDTAIVLSRTDSSVQIPAATIFPVYVDTVNSGAGIVTLTAETGPNLGREPSGNISGNGIGYFWTRSTDVHSFHIAGSGD